MQDFLEQLKSFFLKKKLSDEAFQAYYSKLPENIAVEWFRDGEFIIGTISANGEQFMTQGRSVDEFIEMVNDTIFTVCEIPKEYFPVLDDTHHYSPQPHQLANLNDASLKKSSFGIKKLELAKV